MRFPPIAVVGRGCVLPGALDPDALWRTVAEGRIRLGRVPEGRWGLSPERAIGQPGMYEPDRAWHDIGGYVEGFDEQFDPTGFALPAENLSVLDPSVRWVLHTAREALREAGYEAGPAPGTGLVLGNLSFPSAGMAAYAEQVWRRTGADVRTGTDPRSRFASGLPAHLTARALGLDAGAYALDAACASALYALKLACDRLHDRTADVMVAGAVNCADDLFVHTGFSALSALSRSGRSRPFHRAADGLVPAEGAVLVALMRLEDAVAQGRRVLGVVRGVGLANDGRGAGLLVPSEEGQERAMRAAYKGAGLDPASVSLLECHATGTLVGDRTEVLSTARVFAAADDLAIGSAKGNFGHLITAAGGAGLLKVLGAMEAGIRPPSPASDDPLEALSGTPLRLSRGTETWPGARRAAVSAFGFGGNNAHIVVDSWADGPDRLSERYKPGRRKTRQGTPRKQAQVAVVALAARVANGAGTADFTRALLLGADHAAPREQVEVSLDELRFPPRDLEAAHAQQLLLLDATGEAAAGVRLPRERTMVLTGMGCDPEVARYNARLRAHDLERDAFGDPLDSPAVVGTMANITANRINAQLDLAGPSFAVHAEEASGLAALEIAARAIQAKEADAAVVGAVDLSHEPVHRAALAELGVEQPPGDAAVVLVLKNLALAKKDGDQVLALLENNEDCEDNEGAAELHVGNAWGTEGGRTHGDDGAALIPHFDPTALFGAPHAAVGLLSVAVAVLALHHQVRPRAGKPARPWLEGRTVRVRTGVLEAPPVQCTLRGAQVRGVLGEPAPKLHLYSGADRGGVLDALAAEVESPAGPARLALVARDGAELDELRKAARQWLLGKAPQPPGVAFREAPIDGEIAFTFASGAAAYTGMGSELTLALPKLVRRLGQGPSSLPGSVRWVYDQDDKPDRVVRQIWGASYLCQLHALLTRDVLGITPQATIGYSSGEVNALFAMGAWTDAPAIVRDAGSSPLFAEELAGSFAAVRRVWEREGIAGERWATHLVGASAEQVREAIAAEPAVHLMGINSPDCCTVGGESVACERVLRRLSPQYALALDYDMAAHAPEVREVRDAWRELHLRPTRHVPDVRFYTCGTREHYTASADAAADAITSQVINTVDFVGTVERAWQDGVRVFIEHGPKSLCTDWIRKILGDREHLAVALDAPDRHDVRHLMRSVAELAAAGVPLDSAALHDLLSAAAPPSPRRDGRRLTFPAHPPAVR
ncbi:acyltransferase domain-containing protein, partial [Streptomyces sp. YC504]